MPAVHTAAAAGGRYDLHHAIMYHGGYVATAQQLQRLCSWPPEAPLRNLKELKKQIFEFNKDYELPLDRLPTSKRLQEAGRTDITNVSILH